MVFSNDGTFELTFFDPFRQVDGKPLVYKSIITPEGICVVGECGQNFQLELTCKDKGVYGVRVIVDGYLIPGKKTFRQKGKISGFPQTSGDFKCFKFQRPQLDNESQNKFQKSLYRPVWDDTVNDIRNYSGAAGEIIVKLYESNKEPCEDGGERRSGGGGGQKKPVEPFIPVCKNESKDQFDQTLGITEGELIELPPRQQSNSDDRPPKEFKDVVNFNSIVQSFRVIYKDAESLIEKGYIKLSNHNDLGYLTEEYLVRNEPAIIQVLQTIIESGQKDKELKDIQQNTTIILERLQYYCQGFNIINLFVEKEKQEEIDTFNLQQALEDLVIKFLDERPKYFKKVQERVYGITELFIPKLQCPQTQVEVPKPTQEENGIEQEVIFVPPIKQEPRAALQPKNRDQEINLPRKKKQVSFQPKEEAKQNFGENGFGSGTGFGQGPAFGQGTGFGQGSGFGSGFGQENASGWG